MEQPQMEQPQMEQPQMEQEPSILQTIINDPSYTPYINDNDHVIIKHLITYINQNPQFRSYENILDLIENTLQMANKVCNVHETVLEIMRLTHNETNDNDAAIDAQEAINRASKASDDYDRINHSGLPYLKKQAMLEILSQANAGNKSFIYCIHNIGTYEFYSERADLINWLTELGFTIKCKPHAGDLKIIF